MRSFDFKRITLLSGHYGSGKTNIAVNVAKELKKRYDKVSIADIDIVNPYFRTKDSEKELSEHGIRVISSKYAGSTLDIPALPDEMYAITDDPSYRAVIDVGGDDRGALALGRLVPSIRDEGDYDMFLVINMYRPLTRNAKDTIEVMKEIEIASGLPFTGIINNSNLGTETDENTVLGSLDYAREVSGLAGLEIFMTTVERSLYPALEGRIDDLFPLDLQKKY